ncbi:hypothetical protein L9F63_017413, partial [Diploptera punctata]
GVNELIRIYLTTYRGSVVIAVQYRRKRKSYASLQYGSGMSAQYMSYKTIYYRTPIIILKTALTSVLKVNNTCATSTFQIGYCTDMNRHLTSAYYFIWPVKFGVLFVLETSNIQIELEVLSIHIPPNIQPNF